MPYFPRAFAPPLGWGRARRGTTNLHHHDPMTYSTYTYIDRVGTWALVGALRARALSECIRGCGVGAYDLAYPYKESGASFPADSNLLTKTLTMKNLTFSLQI